MTRRRWLAVGVGIVAIGLGGLVSLYHVPSTLLLGPCLKDWTSPSSYRPRASKLASVRFELDGEPIKVCYGRPVRRGRTVFGGLVPYGRLWRTGANEPTRLFTSTPVDLAGIPLPAGRYSIYTIPGPDRWDVFVTTSTFHWGNAITANVRAREVGSATVPVQTLDAVVDTLTLRPVETPVGMTLLLEWEQTRVALPIVPQD